MKTGLHQQLKHGRTNQVTVINIILGASLYLAGAVVAEEAEDIPLEPRSVERIQQYLNITEHQTILRLQAEERGRQIHESLRIFLGDTYGGAWFDATQNKLAVAITEPKLRNWVRVAGAYPVLVPHSYRQLAEIQQRFLQEIEVNTGWRDAVTGWYIDNKSNQVVVEVLSESWDYVSSRIAGLGVIETAVRLEKSRGRPQFDSDLYGAQRAGNCSIGFSVEQKEVGTGFVWAGHCGGQGEEVTNLSGLLIGVVEASSYPWTLGVNRDHAWVQTNEKWKPQPQVWGYEDGLLEVRGAVRVVDGMLVCRYGAISEGPHCAAVNGTEHYVPMGDVFTLYPLSRADVFTLPGDSGGPYMTASGYGVGIHSASADDPDRPQAYFESLTDALSEFELTLLTSSAGRELEITEFKCPDWENSGDGRYYCAVRYTPEQGAVVNWSSSSNGTSAGDGFFGSCIQSQSVTVSVTVSNSTGSKSSQSTFMCPTGAMP